jgi:hypothetical protein
MVLHVLHSVLKSRDWAINGRSQLLHCHRAVLEALQLFSINTVLNARKLSRLGDMHQY